MIDYKNILIFLIAYSLLFLIAEILHYKVGIKKEFSRKFTHVGGGIIALFLPKFFTQHWYILGLGIVFFIVLYGSKKIGQLQSIHGVARKSVGSTIYPVAIYICFLLASYVSAWEIYYIPVLIMVFADTAAYIAGTVLGWGAYKIGSSQKTAAGSAAFFLVSMLVFYMLNSFGHVDYGFIPILAFCAGATIIEALSINGWDNVSVPIILSVCLYLFY